MRPDIGKTVVFFSGTNSSIENWDGVAESVKGYFGQLNVMEDEDAKSIKYESGPFHFQIHKDGGISAGGPDFQFSTVTDIKLNTLVFNQEMRTIEINSDSLHYSFKMPLKDDHHNDGRDSSSDSGDHHGHEHGRHYDH